MTRRRRSENGSTLLVAVVLLLLLGLMGFAALNTVTQDQQVAGFQNRKKIAFYAAEAGLSESLEKLTTSFSPVLPATPTSIGDASIYPHGQPSYRPDPTVADPFDPLGTTALPGTSLNLGAGAAPTYQISYWRVRVQGNAPRGSVARVEAVAGSLLAN